MPGLGGRRVQHPQDFDIATNPTYILTKNYICGFQIAFISKT